MKYIRSLFILFILLSGRCFAQETLACSQIIEYAQKNLPQSGILKMSNGFVYVDVDDAYIHDLIGFIQDQGFEEPPYFGETYSAGAHISVIYKDETKQYGIQKIDECGQKIRFRLKSCEAVHPPTWQEMDEVYVIVIDAPALKRIRKKYGMPAQMYDFHITIGVKPKVEKAA